MLLLICIFITSSFAMVFQKNRLPYRCPRVKRTVRFVVNGEGRLLIIDFC